MSEKNEQTKSHKTQNGHKFEESLNGLAILTDNAAATKISTLNKAEEKQKKSLAPPQPPPPGKLQPPLLLWPYIIHK